MWTFEGKAVNSHEDLLPGCTDFVYEISYTNGQKYIGKKTIRSLRKLPPTKEQLAKRKNYARREIKNLPFIKYEGSHEGAEGLEIQTKKILYQCRTKKASTYIETALLFEYHAIFRDVYLNLNIAGTHFDNSLDGQLFSTDVELPVHYDSTSSWDRKSVLEQYTREQGGNCCHCKKSLRRAPAPAVADLRVDKARFPEGFFKHPIHLHHDHNTGMTIGAVHAHCNAVLFEYHGE